MKTLTMEQMEVTKAGMPCWAAKAALITAGIAFTFFTVGWGTLIVGMLGVGFSGYGYLESCFSELMS